VKLIYIIVCSREQFNNVRMMRKLLLVFRCPAAMKAASEEVRRTFESSNQKVNPPNSRLVLTREQLDNMPVLGGEQFENISTLTYTPRKPYICSIGFFTQLQRTFYAKKTKNKKK